LQLPQLGKSEDKTTIPKVHLPGGQTGMLERYV